MRECEDFDRGNVRRLINTSWGIPTGCITNDEKYPNWAEWDFAVDMAGNYELLFKYAALLSRPIRIYIDGKLLTDQGCSSTTGGWQVTTAKWELQKEVELTAGPHTLRIERDLFIPHLDAWCLRSAAASIDLAVGRRYLGVNKVTTTLNPVRVPQAAKLVRFLVVGEDGHHWKGEPVFLDDKYKVESTYYVPDDGSWRLWLVIEDGCGRELLRTGGIEISRFPTTERIEGLMEDCRRASSYLAESNLPQQTKEHLSRKLAEIGVKLANLQARLPLRERMSKEEGDLFNEEVEHVASDLAPLVSVAQIASGRITEFLRKKDYYLLADNHLVTLAYWEKFEDEMKSNLPTGYLPGIISLSFFPPNTTRFCFSYPVAALLIEREGKPIKLELDREASYWCPDRLHTEYRGPGNLWVCQETCVADDVVYCNISLKGASAEDSITLQGHPLTGRGTDYVELPGGSGVLHEFTTKDGGVRLYQAVAFSRPPLSLAGGAQGYRAFYPLDNGEFQIAIVATVGRESGYVARRVQEAISGFNAGFEAAKLKWQRFFMNDVPRLLCSDIHLMEIYYTMMYILRADLYEGNVDDPYWQYSYVVPSKWTWRGIWPEDLSHALTGLRWLNSAAPAEDSLRMIIEKFFRYDAEPKAKVHAYGLLTIAAWEVYLKFGNKEFLRYAYPTLCKMNDFVTEKLDTDGDGLANMYDSFMLGWDSSLRFDYEGNLVRDRYFKEALEVVDGNSYYCAQSKLLAHIAERLGDEAGVRKFSERAKRTAEAVRSKMWDEGTGFFYDIFAQSDRLSKVKSCAGFFPMLASIPTAEQNQRLVTLLMDPKEFWLTYPVPCLAKTEPGFPRGIWSGATCLRNNWLIVEGLARNGYREEAARLVERSIALYRQFEPGRMWQTYYYDPITGKGRADTLGTLFSTPIAGVIDMIIKRMAGVVPGADGEIEFDPIALDRDMAFFGISNLTVQGKSVEVRWTKPGTDDFWADGQEGYRVFVDGELRR